MKKVFDAPTVEVVAFTAEVVTKDPSVGDGDVNVNFDDLD